ncbi:hypothetical protein HDF26_004558 [Pedobacter cryoconitis]|uniref:hypothetical protein n=1 Tax=Pedobacter cryoconitis TaxID=188932 RepID=UPI00160FDEC8|nr:hypothetical protein [Pedobacter cryoconitis]MBB6274085.1 hypothetical protein [Pedobacter cryoconitis]
MKHIKNLYLLFIIPFLMINSLSAQVKKNTLSGITPMHEFLKANADTTFILQYTSNWMHTPEYLIISKKGDTISSYTYKSLPKVDKRINLPRAIGYQLNKRNTLDMYATTVDINLYFNPKYLSSDTLKQFWTSIVKLSPWQIKDDSIDGNGCPLTNDNKSRKTINDGGGIILDLITKNGIQRLNFYAPDFFEKEVCPGRAGRKSILGISKLFETYFKENPGR